MLSLKPANLKRYRDIAWLFVKYGQSDLVKGTSLVESLQPADDSDVQNADGGSTPEEFAADLENLGPTYVKLGQLLASRVDILPTSFTDALARLQDDVERVPFEHIERIIFEELGKRADVAFRQFDTTPIAAASLGQVHMATLHNGTAVAVKIQRPGIRLQISEDLEALLNIATELEAHSETARRYELVRIVEQLAVSLKQELDYRQELSNLSRIGRSVSETKSIRVPRSFEGLTTDRVLTMEYVRGEKITELTEGRLTEIDGSQLASDIFRSYLRQILVDGCFHADPHPGNMVLTGDNQVCLLDFGLVAVVDPSMQDHLIKLMLHLSEGQGEQVAREVLKTSREIGTAKPQEFLDRISHLVSHNSGESLQELEVSQIVLQIQSMAAECGISVPDEVKLLGKTLMQLEEVVRYLAPDFNPNEILKQQLGEIVSRRSNDQPTSAAELWGMFSETSELVKAIPERLNHFTKMLAQNEVRIKVDTINEAALLRSLHKIANRITTGLILAALIVGASLMMRLKTPLTIFGYPAIALFFFVTAAVCGLRLIYKAAFVDDRDIT